MLASRTHAAALRGAPPRSIVVAPGHCRSIATTSLRAAAPPPALGAGRALLGDRPALRTTCAAAPRPTGSNADEPSQPRDAAWDTRFEELKAYAATHGGSTNVPQVWSANQSFANWVSRQRMECGTMPAYRKSKLDALSFVWQPLASTWDEHYEQAQAYAETHSGSTEVPNAWEPNPQLAVWVKQQRQLAVRDKLVPERAAKLTALSYAWSNSDAAFAHGLKELAAHAAAHDGSTVVPDVAAGPGAARLREWLRMQRLRKQNGTLSEKRAAQLEQLHFIWEESDAIWQDWLRQLKAYAAAHDGSTRVSKSGSKLGAWVARQREHYAKNTLAPERIAQLDALGFTWKCT